MTIRGVLVWYLGTVIAVGGAGATGYQALRQRAATEAAPATPVVVAEAPPADQPPQSEMQQAPVSVTATEPAHAGPATLPTLRPHVAAASKTAVRHVPRAVAATHAPAHRPTLVASARREAPAERRAPYAASPPPVVGYYPAYYPYAGYYAYYSRYGYYRSF